MRGCAHAYAQEVEELESEEEEETMGLDDAEAEPTYIAPHAHKSQVKYPPDQTKIAKSSVLKQRLQVLTLPLPSHNPARSYTGRTREHAHRFKHILKDMQVINHSPRCLDTRAMTRTSGR